MTCALGIDQKKKKKGVDWKIYIVMFNHFDYTDMLKNPNLTKSNFMIASPILL